MNKYTVCLLRIFPSHFNPFYSHVCIIRSCCPQNISTEKLLIHWATAHAVAVVSGY